jgi:hypothetical protein
MAVKAILALALVLEAGAAAAAGAAVVASIKSNKQKAIQTELHLAVRASLVRERLRVLP